MSTAIDQLVQAIEELGSGFLLVVTGAGASRASGLSTFRGPEPEAVWNRDDVEIATAGYFHTDPVAHWQWYASRFGAMATAQPNPGQVALTDLESWHRARGGRFLLITQNIDTLHEQAGSRELIKVHGSSDRVRCSRSGCRFASPSGSISRRDVDFESFLAAPSIGSLPSCPDCGAPVRPHVLLFDEYYQDHVDYRFDEVVNAAETADLLLFVGTSFSVGVTDLLVRSALRRRVAAYSIDPAATRLAPSPGIRPLDAAAEEALPQIAERLGIRTTGHRRSGADSAVGTLGGSRPEKEPGR